MRSSLRLAGWSTLASVILTVSCLSETPQNPKEESGPAAVRLAVDYQGALGPVSASRAVHYALFTQADLPGPPAWWGQIVENRSPAVIPVTSGTYYLAVYLGVNAASGVSDRDFEIMPGDPYEIYDGRSRPPGTPLVVSRGDTAEVAIDLNDSHVYAPPTSGDFLPAFDRFTYFPIVENATWTYDWGVTVKVTSVNAERGTYRIENVGSAGMLDGTSGVDDLGAYAAIDAFTDPGFLPVHDYFGFQPVMYADSLIVPGFAWGNDGYSGDRYGRFYPVQNRLRVVSVADSFMTPGGYVYHRCAVLERTILYPEGYHWNPYLSAVTYYLKRGVGFVAEIRRWSDGSTQRHYVTSYRIP